MDYGVSLDPLPGRGRVPRRQVTVALNSEKPETRRHPRRRFWRVCRIYFRRVRITVWLVILLLLGTLVYLNHVGLPDFVKKPLLEKLGARGLNLQFSRLRLRWYQGLIADQVRFESEGEEFSPRLTVDEVQLLLDWRALAHFQFRVNGLVLRQGRLSWPIVETNQPARELTVERIDTNLRFLAGDEWTLDNFKARMAGVRVQLSGSITNASAIRDWRFLQGEAAAGSPEILQRRLRRLADTLERIRFYAPPELLVNVRGDKRYGHPSLGGNLLGSTQL